MADRRSRTLAAACVAALAAFASPAAAAAEAAAQRGPCDGPNAECVRLPGRISARFVQVKSLELDDGGKASFAQVQNALLARNQASVGRLEVQGETRAQSVSLRRLSSPNDAGVRIYGGLQINGRVVVGQLLSASDVALDAPLGALPESAAFLEEAVHVYTHGDGGDEGDEEAASPAEVPDDGLFFGQDEEEQEEADNGPAQAPEQAPAQAPRRRPRHHLRQWRLVAHDAFGSELPRGWRLRSQGGDERPVAESDAARCVEGGHVFVAARGAAGPLPSLVKRFGPLPPHRHLEVTARLHLVDAWRGGVAFAKADGNVVWLQQHGDARGDDGAVSLCGGDYPGDRLSVPVRVVIPHEAEYAELEFGGIFAAGQPAPAAGSEPALGLDDVALLVL